MKNITEILVLVVYAAIVFTLVRPQSQGPALIKNIGDGLTEILQAAMGDTKSAVSPSKAKKS